MTQTATPAERALALLGYQTTPEVAEALDDLRNKSGLWRILADSLDHDQFALSLLGTLVDVAFTRGQTAELDRIVRKQTADLDADLTHKLGDNK